MCTTCGCSSGNTTTFTLLNDTRFAPLASGAAFSPLRGHVHVEPTPASASPTPVPHPQTLARTHAREHGTTLELEKRILDKNDRLAAAHRQWLHERRILALNLVSSPGAGKTSLLERTIRELKSEVDISVIEGDQETLFDAQRIRATGVPAVQINTGTGCHLEADMLGRALDELQPSADSLLMIENVGNLVCPALFDLGEDAKVVILSVTEGADKPLKYPHMFRASRLLLLNKVDLLPYVDFDLEACCRYARQINPEIEILPVSATRGDGLEHWFDWIRAQRLPPPR